VSYVDVKIGIPSVLLCIEMALFSVLHIFAFPWKPYDISKSETASAFYDGGTMGWRAIMDAFNPMDFVKAAARGFRWLFVGIRNRHNDDYEAYKDVHAAAGSTSIPTSQKISRPYPLSADPDDEYLKPGPESQGIELTGGLHPPKRQATDEYSDSQALLGQAQRMPISATASPESRPLYMGGGPEDRSATSTPPAYSHMPPHAPVSPGLAPMQLRDPVHRIDSPPSPMDERMAFGGIGRGRADEERRHGVPERRDQQQPRPAQGRGDFSSDHPPPPFGYGKAF
jgi:hypothetical protein